MLAAMFNPINVAKNTPTSIIPLETNPAAHRTTVAIVAAASPPNALDRWLPATPVRTAKRIADIPGSVPVA